MLEPEKTAMHESGGNDSLMNPRCRRWAAKTGSRSLPMGPESGTVPETSGFSRGSSPATLWPRLDHGWRNAQTPSKKNRGEDVQAR